MICFLNDRSPGATCCSHDFLIFHPGLCKTPASVGVTVASPSTYLLYRQKSAAIKTVSCISMSVAPSCFASRIAVSVTALPLCCTCAAMLSNTFILSLTGAVLYIGLHFFRRYRTHPAAHQQQQYALLHRKCIDCGAKQRWRLILFRLQ